MNGSPASYIAMPEWSEEAEATPLSPDMKDMEVPLRIPHLPEWNGQEDSEADAASSE